MLKHPCLRIVFMCLSPWATCVLFPKLLSSLRWSSWLHTRSTIPCFLSWCPLTWWVTAPLNSQSLPPTTLEEPSRLPQMVSVYTQKCIFVWGPSRRFKIQTWLMLEFGRKRAALLLWVTLLSVSAVVLQVPAVPACLSVRVCRFLPQVAGTDRLLLN